MCFETIRCFCWTKEAIEALPAKTGTNLFNEENYNVLYITLQLYVELGLKLTKIHGVMQFNN